jgi:hypothetical protein
MIELFTQKIVTKLSKIWVWDPGSEIRKKPIPDPGSRGQKGTGSRIPDLDPQHCQKARLKMPFKDSILGPSKPEPWENTEAASVKENSIVWTINKT